jgi:hypothetical protein
LFVVFFHISSGCQRRLRNGLHPRHSLNAVRERTHQLPG